MDLGQWRQARGYTPLTKASCFFLSGAATLINSWRLDRMRYVLLDVLTDDAMLFRLELRREASRKKLFYKIHSPVSYLVLNFKN
jgi:hypothetical protein